MSVDGKMNVVFCWHMHQPDYRDMMTGEYYFPWTYLHAIKDYVDMVAHLENHPKAQAVFNFAPILLEQIEDYAHQIEDYLNRGKVIKDSLLAALVAPTLPKAGSASFLELSQKCLRANRERIIDRFPAYAHLADTLTQIEDKPRTQRYISEQFLADLLVWYHLGWMGETLRRKDSRIKRLQEQEHEYSLEDRRELLKIIGDQLSSIGPRYRRLAERGQIELAMSPYAHPIVPLLLDLNSASEAMPDVTLPKAKNYPGGEARARWHLHHGVTAFERFFGHRPRGCWASEGALSDATLALLREAQFAWTATGDSVLHNSLRHSDNASACEELKEPGAYLHQAYEFADIPIKCFFRDDGLSDLIGFKYATWHADDAVGDLLNHMEAIAKTCTSKKDGVISIIMDGENAWEYFPENAFYFLDALYKRLSDHPILQLTTYSKILDQQKPEPAQVPHLVAGSWVYGSFSTWIGDQDKNRGWDMLCEAKRRVDQVLAGGKLTPEQVAHVEKQLALCEGSDWFWWFGDYNPAQSVSDFEHLFRRHLMNLYTLIDSPTPDYLCQSISKGSGAPAAGGVMRQGHADQGGR
jgi:alpha-amylase/alpha-mannosidase (GH57 family)